jgi:predicted DNA-binding protein YlxM (UPF0122 family)
MDNLTQRALLFDFYGSLLTKKQREIYDLYFQQDLSLGEIGELQDVSRTAIYDLVKRTEGTLQHYEERLGLVRKYVAGHAILAALRQQLESLQKQDNDSRPQEEAWTKVYELLQKLEESW